MYSKNILYFFIWIILPFNPIFAHNFLLPTYHTQSSDDYDHYIQTLASLVFHTQEWEETLKSGQSYSEQEIDFSSEEIEFLWKKAAYYLSASIDQSHDHLETAYQEYEKTKQFVALEQVQEAQEALHSSSTLLFSLWKEAIELEEKFSLHFSPASTLLRSKPDLHVKHNPYISTKVKNKITPYLLSFDHPMRKVLDKLCLNTRVTANEETFHQAGFETLDNRPRSFIRVASHPKMNGYLVKVYLDTVLKEKQNKPSWEWLVKRCEGASKIRKIIQERQIHYFVVADKWIYCFPPEPSPPNTPAYMRHLALLVVTNMDLAPKEQNYQAWRDQITPEHLDELYVIISRGKGSSYRPDNIAYTNSGKFAFIDTEYPSRKPDFKSIRHFLNSNMRKYWDTLIKNGGS